jgi:hypothetical protein
MMLSIPLLATTHDTMANTPRGVSLITQEINLRIPLLRVSVSVLSCNTSSRFPYDMRATHRIIPIVTICMALSSTNATIILSGTMESKNHEKLKDSSFSGEKFSKSKFTHFPG